MPWKYTDAVSHTKKARSSAQKEEWSSVANSVLDKSGDDAKAIRIANYVIKKKHVGIGRKKKDG